MKKKKSLSKNRKSRGSKILSPQWNLKLLYNSPHDPRMETDIRAFERNVDSFAMTYDVPEKKFLQEPTTLLQALIEYEKLIGEFTLKAHIYFYYLRDIESTNKEAAARIALIENRLAKAQNKVVFFENSLGKIGPEMREKFLQDSMLAHFHVFLRRVFQSARHDLSVPEERILNLKTLPSHEMWSSANEALMNVRSIVWKGKQMPLSQATQLMLNTPQAADRKKLSLLVNKVLKEQAAFAEWEINAIFTNKKINDELRGYATPYAYTVLQNDNNPQTVDTLIETVNKHVAIAHRFYRLKAKLLKQKTLNYCDRGVSIGEVKIKSNFEQSLTLLKETFGKLNPKFESILDSYVKKRQIDVAPRIGKTAGAYCSSSFLNPTFVLLNHNNDLNSLSTFAHEMGHAYHSEFSRHQGPIYSNYSMSLAETASTLFESILMEKIFDSLSDKEKIILLHDKINDDISTIFRQVACFNFENNLHQEIRSKGHLAKEVIAQIHNKNMKAYLGPVFKIEEDDGYFFVTWSHIRRFFYVYSYAFGQLVTKAFLRRYKQDPSFWSSVEVFLSSGGKDSPENILKSIGIDVSHAGFWEEGLKEIEENILKLEKLTK